MYEERNDVHVDKEVVLGASDRAGRRRVKETALVSKDRRRGQHC